MWLDKTKSNEELFPGRLLRYGAKLWAEVEGDIVKKGGELKETEIDMRKLLLRQKAVFGMNVGWVKKNGAIWRFELSEGAKARMQEHEISDEGFEDAVAAAAANQRS